MIEAYDSRIAYWAAGIFVGVAVMLLALHFPVPFPRLIYVVGFGLFVFSFWRTKVFFDKRREGYHVSDGS